MNNALVCLKIRYPKIRPVSHHFPSQFSDALLQRSRFLPSGNPTLAMENRRTVVGNSLISRRDLIFRSRIPYSGSFSCSFSFSDKSFKPDTPERLRHPIVSKNYHPLVHIAEGRLHFQFLIGLVIYVIYVLYTFPLFSYHHIFPW